MGTIDNPQPVIESQALRYVWGECALCHRVTLCMDFDDSLGDLSGSSAMSCCGRTFDDRTRPIRNSPRLRRAIAAAESIGGK